MVLTIVLETVAEGSPDGWYHVLPYALMPSCRPGCASHGTSHRAIWDVTAREEPGEKDMVRVR